MSRLPVEQLPARIKPLDLSGTEVHHLPDWKGYEDPRRLEIIQHISKMRGRDPRIANLAVDIIRKAKVKPRDYRGQAAALLKWVQDPDNVYYVNEPGERLQDPIFTIKQGWGDCDDQVIVLMALLESVRLPWKLVLAGTCPTGRHKIVNGRRIPLTKKIRYIQGQKFPQGCKWAHIYGLVGNDPFHPDEWYFAETTIQGVPLGWDVISGDKKYLPELESGPKRKPRVIGAGRAPARHRPSPLPAPQNRSPAYGMSRGFVPSPHSQGYGQSALSPVGAAVGASMATEMEDTWSWGDEKAKAKQAIIDIRKVLPAVLTGVAISVTTQILLDFIRPRVGSNKRKAK